MKTMRNIIPRSSQIPAGHGWFLGRGRLDFHDEELAARDVEHLAGDAHRQLGPVRRPEPDQRAGLLLEIP
jgi:hypothetical protein